MAAALDFLQGDRVPVEPGAIERALRDLWREGGNERSEGSAGEPVLRARAATLIVYTDEPGALDALDPVVAEAALRFPGRALVLTTGEPPGAPGAEAWVAARCYPRRGTHVCGEQVTILAGGEPPVTVPALVAALRPPDIPAALYWRARNPNPTLLAALAEGASLLIFDSARTPLRFLEVEGARHTALPTTSSRSSSSSNRHGPPVPSAPGPTQSPNHPITQSPNHPIADLAWLRLLPWREAVAAWFDPPDVRPLLGALNRVDLTLSPASARPDAALLAAWLASRLGWEPAGPDDEAAGTWTFRPTGGRAVAVTIHQGDASGGFAPNLGFSSTASPPETGPGHPAPYSASPPETGPGHPVPYSASPVGATANSPGRKPWESKASESPSPVGAAETRDPGTRGDETHCLPTPADPAGLRSIELRAGDTSFRLERLPGTACARATVTLPGDRPRERLLSLPAPSEGELLCAAIAAGGTDPVYLAANEVALGLS